MKRKLLIVSAAVLTAAAASLAYITSIALPVNIKTLASSEIEKATGKKVVFSSISIDPVRGLVMEDLVIYDKKEILIWAKDAEFSIRLLPLFVGKIVVSSVKIGSPAIYLERRPDGSFNLASLAPEAYAPGGGITLAPQRIIVKNGRVLFVDKTLNTPFKERVDNISVHARLDLPEEIRYAISCEIPSSRPVELMSSGKYSLRSGELSAGITANDICPEDFRVYYKSTGFKFPAGTVDTAIGVLAKDGVVDLDIKATAKKLSAANGAFRAVVDSEIKMMMRYAFKDKSMEYAGRMEVSRMDIEGIELLGRLENIKASIEFDDSRVWSDNIAVNALGVPWKARINIVNFAGPVFDIYASCDTHLSALKRMAEESFGLKTGAEVSGKSVLNIAIHMEPDKPPRLNGYLNLRDATIGLGRGNFPLDSINGEVRFGPGKLEWNGLDLRYRNVPYKTSGTLTDFSSPKISLSAFSGNLSFMSDFIILGSGINISRLEGRYFDSRFNFNGEIDFGGANVLNSELAGRLDLELKDFRKIENIPAGLVKMKPDGKVSVDLRLSGDLGDPKMCGIKADIRSARASLYGYRLTDLSVTYSQEEGVCYIRSMRASCYGGTMSLSGRLDLLSRGFPYAATIDARGIKLGLLKKETGAKDKDISGDLMLHLNVTGLFKDVSRLAGLGHLGISNSRLWQLNLFKGFGSLIFTEDFEDIVFTDGKCDFRIKDRTLFADYLIMKSELINMYGSGAVGFDRSVSGVLQTELTDMAMDPGTQKNVADVIGKYTYAEVSGTLEKPRFEMKSSVPDIVVGVAGALFRQEQ